MGKNSLKTHRFFCLNCGSESVPLMRKQGHQHGRFHRKKLYCYHCKTEINHIECKDEGDIYEFKMNYKEGAYKHEAEESLVAVRSQWQW